MRTAASSTPARPSQAFGPSVSRANWSARAQLSWMSRYEMPASGPSSSGSVAVSARMTVGRWLPSPPAKPRSVAGLRGVLVGPLKALRESSWK